MSFHQGGVKVTSRQTLAPDQWLVLRDGEIIAGGFTHHGHVTVWPGCEIALTIEAYRRRRWTPIPGGAGLIFRFGKDGYRKSSAERAEPVSSPGSNDPAS
jgi:hypothetical protein